SGENRWLWQSMMGGLSGCFSTAAAGQAAKAVPEAVRNVRRERGFLAMFAPMRLRPDGPQRTTLTYPISLPYGPGAARQENHLTPVAQESFVAIFPGPI